MRLKLSVYAAHTCFSLSSSIVLIDLNKVKSLQHEQTSPHTFNCISAGMIHSLIKLFIKAFSCSSRNTVSFNTKFGLRQNYGFKKLSFKVWTVTSSSHIHILYICFVQLSIYYTLLCMYVFIITPSNNFKRNH